MKWMERGIRSVKNFMWSEVNLMSEWKVKFHFRNAARQVKKINERQTKRTWRSSKQSFHSFRFRNSWNYWMQRSQPSFRMQLHSKHSFHCIRSLCLFSQQALAQLRSEREFSIVERIAWVKQLKRTQLKQLVARRFGKLAGAKYL